MVSLALEAPPVQSGPLDDEYDLPSLADLDWAAAHLNADHHSDIAFPGEPLLPFDELIETHAAYYRSLDTPFGAWLAKRIDELAATARFLKATSPDQFDGRIATLHADRDERLRDEGYAAGRDSCPCQVGCA